MQVAKVAPPRLLNSLLGIHAEFDFKLVFAQSIMQWRGRHVLSTDEVKCAFAQRLLDGDDLHDALAPRFAH